MSRIATGQSNHTTHVAPTEEAQTPSDITNSMGALKMEGDEPTDPVVEASPDPIVTAISSDPPVEEGAGTGTANEIHEIRAPENLHNAPLSFFLDCPDSCRSHHHAMIHFLGWMTLYQRHRTFHE